MEREKINVSDKNRKPRNGANKKPHDMKKTHDDTCFIENKNLIKSHEQDKIPEGEILIDENDNPMDINIENNGPEFYQKIINQESYGIINKLPNHQNEEHSSNHQNEEHSSNHQNEEHSSNHQNERSSLNHNDEEQHSSNNKILIERRFIKPKNRKSMRKAAYERMMIENSQLTFNNKDNNLDLSDAMIFMKKVKDEFTNEPSIYDQFLELMRDFKQCKITAKCVVKAASNMFKNRPILCNSFSDFLPPNLRKYEKSVRALNERLKIINDNLDTEDIITDSLNEFDNSYSKEISLEDQKIHNQKFLQTSDKSYHKKHDYQRQINKEIEDRNYKNNNLIKLNSNKNVDNERQSMAQKLINEVKNRLIDQPVKYRMFLEILSQHQQKKITIENTISSLKKIIGDHPDLIREFIKFMPEDNEKDTIDRIKMILERKGVYDDFLKCLNLKNQDLISNKDFITLIRPLINNKELLDGLKKYINYSEVDQIEEGMNDLKGEKIIGQRIGSYKIISNDSRQWDIDHDFRRKLKDSGIVKRIKTKNIFDKNANLKISIIDSLKSNKIATLNDDILNTFCISVPTLTSKDNDFIHQHKNYFEESLYRVEEERYEYDILIEKLLSLIQNLENIFQNFNTDKRDLTIADFDMPEPLITDILSYIYNKQSEEIFDEILNNPEAAIPVILNRLYRVMEQWKKEYRSRGEGWRDIVNQNYYKALDVQGYKFKTDEKKRNSQRSVRQEFEKGFIASIVTNISGTENKKIKSPNDLLHEMVTEVLFIKLKNPEEKSGKPRFLKKTLFLIEKILELLKKKKFEIKVDFQSAILFRHILVIFEKINFVKSLPIKKIEINEIAANLGYDLYGQYRKYEDPIEVLIDYLKGKIDNLDFENIVRIITDCKGYKILTIDKILERIYRIASGMYSKSVEKYFKDENQNKSDDNNKFDNDDNNKFDNDANNKFDNADKNKFNNEDNNKFNNEDKNKFNNDKNKFNNDDKNKFNNVDNKFNNDKDDDELYLINKNGNVVTIKFVQTSKNNQKEDNSNDISKIKANSAKSTKTRVKKKCEFDELVNQNKSEFNANNNQSNTGDNCDELVVIKNDKE
ncbi:Paired amphipathic helix protein Sin3b [Dictyocoela muelleri]|nr:Paired amphipathic helix protein Sin3b [Dictyocoela muelleri]